jgi:nucleoside-triphosphatase THEP1
MVYIIQGEINQGKTQEILSIYNRDKQGDGFVSKKIFINQTDFIGYEIVRLSTGEKMPLAYKSQHVPPHWEKIDQCGPFSFSKAAFVFAEHIIDDIIARHIDPVFIDEIGPLELDGNGFFAILEKILKAKKDVYITVRNHCVKDVINKFNIQDYKMIMLNEKNIATKAPRHKKTQREKNSL